MSLNLNNFTSEIRANGTQPLNRFIVQFEPPKGITSSANGAAGNNLFNSLFNNLITSGHQDTQQLSLRCHSATFPGTHLMTKDDIMRYGHGPVDKTVHNALFSDINCAFILDTNGQIMNFFYNWQKLIVPSDSSQGMDTPFQGGASAYEVEYKDNYVTNLNIQMYREVGSRVVTCVAQKAFPVFVGEMTMAWESTNQVAILPVTFSYRDHKITTQ